MLFHTALATYLLLAGTPGGRSSADEKTSAELRRMSQELLDAIAPGKVEVWERYLDDRFVLLDENGTVTRKAELLKEFTPLPPGLVGRIEIDKFDATFAGNTAVVAVEVQEYLDYHGQQLRTRFRSLDTWISTPNGWRLLGQHAAAVLKDPPAITLSSKELSEYEGVYTLTAEIKTTIRVTDNGFTSEREGRPVATYKPELRDLFFAAGSPRSRRIFTRDAKGKVDGFVDRREGEDIRWKKAVAP